MAEGVSDTRLYIVRHRRGCPGGMAQAASVDWKFSGGASLDGHSESFYDARGVAKGQDGHIRVWTKVLFKRTWIA
jgi:hypothetical protein